MSSCPRACSPGPHAAVGTARPPVLGNPETRPRPAPTPGAGPRRRLVLAVTLSLALFLGLSFGPRLYGSARTQELSYSTFLSDLEHHQVTAVAVGSAGELTGTLTGGQRFTRRRRRGR